MVEGGVVVGCDVSVCPDDSTDYTEAEQPDG